MRPVRLKSPSFRISGMRSLSLLVALALCLPAAADVKLKTRTTVSDDAFDSTIYVRGSRLRVEPASDAVVTIYQCDQHRLLQVNPVTRSYRIVALDPPAEAAPMRPARTPRSGAASTVVFTTTFAAGSRDQKMHGFLAHKFFSKTEAEASPDSCSKADTVKLTTSGWYADLPDSDLSCADPARAALHLRKVEPGCMERTSFRTEGKPPTGLALELETTMTTSSGLVTTRQQALALERTSLAADLFEIPADYRLVRTDEELRRDLTQNPAAAGPPATEPPAAPASRPSRSTRTGEPRPTLMRVCLSPVTGSTASSPKSADWTRLELGRRLNAQSYESVPVEAGDTQAANDQAKAQGCAFVLTAEFKEAEEKHTDGKEKSASVFPASGEKTNDEPPLAARFTLRVPDSSSPLWADTVEAQSGETRDAFLDRAVKLVAAQISSHEK